MAEHERLVGAGAGRTEAAERDGAARPGLARACAGTCAS